ncbi:MAG: FAD-dependent tricarballylate dehydrogenase TcuA [Deltaproteobacteria bacterium]|nr:FAD-dependent tricarballylate dehydrogenase TcuA [Deltaproteobacteria bacterium]
MRTEAYDVVVVGFGNAAQAAAFSAHQTGAKVLVLEKAPKAKRGGNTWFSFGAQFRHVHNGISDCKPLLPHVPEKEWEKIDVDPYTKDDFYSDIMRVTRGRSVPELAELLVNESYSTVKWMQESGIQWEILYSGAVPEGDRFRWHHGSSFIHSKDGGAGLVEMWYRILQSKGIEIRFDTAAARLLTDDKARVYGIVAKDPEGFTEIHCKGVVLACGGFQANPAMRAQFLGAGWDLGKVRGTKYDTGDGIQMALDIGAQPFGHWGGSHTTPIDADAGDYEAGFLDPANRRYRTHRYAWTLGIMVNLDGRRFLDEGEDFHAYTYAKTGAEIVKQPGSMAYQIFDTKIKDAIDRYHYAGATPVEANSVRELAEKLEINPDVLVKTVEEFNQAVMEDRPFNEVIRDGKGTKGIYPPKTNWAQKIDTPPFIAYAATGGLTFTYGGLKINNRCEVLDRMDRPIPGLYGAGELTGGFFYYNYPSGGGLMRGAVTGRIAGRNAAG